MFAGNKKKHCDHQSIVTHLGQTEVNGSDRRISTTLKMHRSSVAFPTLPVQRFERLTREVDSSSIARRLRQRDQCERIVVILIHHDADVYLPINGDHGAAFLLLSQAIPHDFLADQPHRCEEKYIICTDIIPSEKSTNCDTYLSLYGTKQTKQDSMAIQRKDSLSR